MKPPTGGFFVIFLVQSTTMRQSSAALFRIIIAIVAWFALGLQQYIIIDKTPGNGMTPLGAVWHFLIYFTILTNLLIAIGITSIIIAPNSAAGRFFSRSSVATGMALYIFIVGLVYNVALRQIWEPVGRDRVADELLHVVVPLLYLLYWIFFANKKGLQWKHLLYWLSFPAFYIVYALVRGSVEGFYAYYFINLDKLGAGKVILNSVLLLAAFVVAGLIFIVAGRRLSRRGM